MSAIVKSRWVDEDEEPPEAIAQRKRDKEEKKRLKEERLRRAAEVNVPPPAASEEAAAAAKVVNGESEPPTKRRKTSNEGGQHGPPRDGDESRLLQFPTNAFGPCKDVDEYELLNNIEEGSYGMVSRARVKTTGEVVALKRLKMEYTNDGFPVTGLREIQTLMASRHNNNIVKLREVVTGGGTKE